MALLLISSILAFANVHSKVFVNQFLSWYKKPTARDKELFLQKQTLLDEQNKLHIVDDFAKYSKLQRKINKIDQDIEEEASQKNNLFTQFGLVYGVKFVFGFFLLILSIYYRHTPVLILDNELEFTPFSSLISYPNHEKNAVSFHFWIMCCTVVARQIKFSTTYIICV